MVASKAAVAARHAVRLSSALHEAGDSAAALQSLAVTGVHIAQLGTRNASLQEAVALIARSRLDILVGDEEGGQGGRVSWSAAPEWDALPAEAQCCLLETESKALALQLHDVSATLRELASRYTGPIPSYLTFSNSLIYGGFRAPLAVDVSQDG